MEETITLLAEEGRVRWRRVSLTNHIYFQQKLGCNVILNMLKKHRNDNIRGAELRQVAVRLHDLDNGVAAEVAVEVLGNHHGDRHVLHALDDMAGDGDKAENVSHVASEDGLGHTQGYVRAHVEQGSAKLLNSHGVHVATHGQWGEPRAPGLVVRLHCLE